MLFWNSFVKQEPWRLPSLYLAYSLHGSLFVSKLPMSDKMCHITLFGVKASSGSFPHDCESWEDEKLRNVMWHTFCCHVLKKPMAADKAGVLVSFHINFCKNSTAFFKSYFDKILKSSWGYLCRCQIILLFLLINT